MADEPVFDGRELPPDSPKRMGGARRAANPSKQTASFLSDVFPKKPPPRLSWRAALVVAAVAATFHLSAEPAVTVLPDPALHRFDLEPVVAPKLSGLGLAILARVVRLPVVGPAVCGLLKNANGVHVVRAFAAATGEAPLYYPAVPPTPEQLERHERLWGEHPPAPTGRLARYTEAYGKGAKPAAIVERTLKAMAMADAMEPPLAPFVVVDADGARKAAARPRQGSLSGIPVAVKDEVDLEGFPTRLGTTFLAPVARSDGVPVARLKAAGAIIVAKTAMHEIGAGTTGHRTGGPTPRNPHDATRYPGGSSSGSAVAVASGLVPAALAFDGGGSIRIPAALCGVVGLKPTFGRIPVHNLHDPSVGVAGPIGADAAATAAAYLAMAGPATEDELGPGHAPYPPQPPPHAARLRDTADLSDVRVGVFPELFAAADSEVVLANAELLRDFEKRGAVIVNVSFPSLLTMSRAHSITILSEFANHLEKYHVKHAGSYSGDTQVKLTMARTFTARDVLAAQVCRAFFVKAASRLFDEVDVFATPATATVAAPVASRDTMDLVLTERYMRFSLLANFVGSPSIAFPSGVARNKAPMSMMLTGRWWEEHTLLRMAQAAEDIRGGVPKPARYYDDAAP